MNMINLLRIKNRILGAVAPDRVAHSSAKMFLTPRKYALKEWEEVAEKSCRRIRFSKDLSAASWGNGEKKILLMHGWESRATQMHTLVMPLVEKGYTVIAIDGPMHGHSNGDRANPVTFAEAVTSAANELGPFDGAIGHSMGAAAIAIAMESGARFDRCVLMSSPACLHNVLTAFADYVGLSQDCRDRFVSKVEQTVGRSSKELDVGKIFAQIKPDVLLVHDREDKEIPYSSLENISRAYPDLKTHSVTGFGHRKILRDPEISETVARFITSGAV